MPKKRQINSQKICRPTFYMNEELLHKVMEQAEQESLTMSRFVVEILNFLLLSIVGRKLLETARSNQRTLAQELQQNLILLNEQLPTEEIYQLAATSRRTPDQMVVYLVLLGLQVYTADSRNDSE